MINVNPYPWGQCTWYMWELIKWLQPLGPLGNANTWRDKLKTLGYPETQLPTVGDLVCFQDGWDGADPTYGHVAMCIATSADGDFTVREMNATAGLGVSDDRGNLLPGAGITFISNKQPQEQDDMALALLTRDPASGADPHGPGAVYLAEGVAAPNGTFVPVRKRHIAAPVDLGDYTGLGFQVLVVPGYILDRAEDGPEIGSGEYPPEP